MVSFCPAHLAWDTAERRHEERGRGWKRTGEVQYWEMEEEREMEEMVEKVMVWKGIESVERELVMTFRNKGIFDFK